MIVFLPIETVLGGVVFVVEFEFLLLLLGSGLAVWSSVMDDISVFPLQFDLIEDLQNESTTRSD